MGRGKLQTWSEIEINSSNECNPKKCTDGQENSFGGEKVAKVKL